MLAVALGGMALFFVSWALLHYGSYTDNAITDLPVYERYGRAIADGEVPYRDFRPEYPPLALPAFALPALDDGESGYRRVFEALMAACGALAVGLVALTLAAVRAPPFRIGAAVAAVALAPLALGNVLLSRFDLWPALLVVAALLALVSSREQLGSGLLGLGVAAKIYPGVLVPLAVAWMWRRHGRREALVCLGISTATVAACFLPFLVVAPEGVAASLGRQLSRPLQIESLGAALLVAVDHLGGPTVEMDSGRGSQNVAGAAGTVVGVVASLVQAAALVWIWVRFARGPADTERLLRFAAAALVAFVALGKVVSPQFLIWLIPVVPLVAGRRGLAASALLGAALVATHGWFPDRYWDYALTFDTGVSWLVLVRDLLLVGVLLALLARPPGREPARS